MRPSTTVTLGRVATRFSSYGQYRRQWRTDSGGKSFIRQHELEFHYPLRSSRILGNVHG